MAATAKRFSIWQEDFRDNNGHWYMDFTLGKECVVFLNAKEKN